MRDDHVVGSILPQLTLTDLERAVVDLTMGPDAIPVATAARRLLRSRAHVYVVRRQIRKKLRIVGHELPDGRRTAGHGRITQLSQIDKDRN